MAGLLQTLTDHGKVCVGAGYRIHVLDEYTVRNYDGSVSSGQYWTTIRATRGAVMRWLGY